jgi:parvulin-like peptidyl-prolyl isomerase
VNVGQEDEIKAKAEDIRKRVGTGEDFGKVAAEVSASPSKANGGLIGPINTAELSPQLQDLLAKMKPGEVSQPIRTSRGFQILKLESSKPSTVPEFENVRDVAADKVHEARQRTEVRRFLSRIRGQAIIEWKNEELKKAYEKAVSAPPPAATGN